MDNLSRVGIFVAVVKNESFVSAARDLGITSSAVSKQVQNLEHDLEVKLLNRTTRKVSLTEEGALFFERASRALEDIEEATEQIHELKACPRGSLKISMPHGLSAHYLKKDIAAFARQYPDIHLDISFDDRFVDIVSDGFDIVVRIGSLQDSSLIARRLASCPITVCASPEYLESHGKLEAPEDLVEHNMLAYNRNTRLHEWRYKCPDGKYGQVSLNGTFKSDNGQMLSEAAIHGIGVAILPIFYVADHLKTGALKQVLTDYTASPQRDIQAVFMPNRYLSTRLRLFVDHLTEICKNLPWE